MADTVLVVGDVMTDIIVKPAGPIAWGSDTPATIEPMPGGSAANAATWPASSGVRVRFVSRVGVQDAEHQAAILRAAGVEPALSIDPNHSTGSLVTIVSGDGERSFLTSRGANAHLRASDLGDRILEDVTLVHVSGYAFFDPGPCAAMRDFIARARGRGLTVTVDPASGAFLRHVGPDNFLHWTREASACFPNAQEAEVLTGAKVPQAQFEMLLRHYPLVVIKRGAKGADAMENGDCTVHRAAAPSVLVVDTTGAGDAFLAGFLSTRLRGGSLDECLKAGTTMGSNAVTSIGGRPPVLTRIRGLGPFSKTCLKEINGLA